MRKSSYGSSLVLSLPEFKECLIEVQIHEQDNESWLMAPNPDDLHSNRYQDPGARWFRLGQSQDDGGRDPSWIIHLSAVRGEVGALRPSSSHQGRRTGQLSEGERLRG